MVAIAQASRVRTYHEEVLSHNMTPEIDDYVTADYINHLFPPGMPPGPESEKQLLSIFRAGFPDLTLTVEDIVDAGDKVAVRWRFRATHDGNFQGIQATGRKVDMDGITIVHMEGDKLKETWPSLDMFTLMQQIGIIPTPGQ